MLRMQKMSFFKILPAALLLLNLLVSLIFSANADDRGESASLDIPAKKRIPLKIWEIPNRNDSNPMVEAELAVIEAFSKRYPEIDLESFSGVRIAGRAMDSTILLAIAGGSAPDVLYVNFRQSDTFIQQSFLYPLDEFIARDISLAELERRVPPAVRPVIKRDGPRVENIPSGEHYWVLPYNLVVRALFYRKDLFEEAGLDPDKPPKDWNELYNYARKISDPQRGLYGIGIGGGPQSAWDFASYLWSAGGDIVQQQKNGDWAAVFNSADAVEALNFYLKLTSERWIDTDGRTQYGYSTRLAGIDSAQAWSEGRIGMMVHYLDEKSIASGVDPSFVAIAPFPNGPSGKSETEINCKMMGIFSGIKARTNSNGEYISVNELREAAWKYILFYDSYEGRKAKIDRLVELGLGNMLNPKLLHEYGYTDYVNSTPNGWIKVFESALENGKPEPYGKNCQEVYAYMTEPVNAAVEKSRNGQLPSDAFARKAELKKILDEAVEKTNLKMLGKLSPEEHRKRNMTAGICGIVFIVIFCFLLYRIWLIFTPLNHINPQIDAASARRGHFARYTPAYIILIPAIASILIWNYLPLLMGARLIFVDYKFIGDTQFTGLQNIAEVLYSPDWWNALYTTIKYMGILLGLGFGLPIILAIFLQEISHGKTLYSIIYYIPAVMSGIVVVYIWKLFLGGDSSGLLNQILSGIGDCFGYNVEASAWLEDSSLAIFCCAIPTIWAGIGPGCLIYMAALKSIPEEIYESADIDGCSFCDKVFYLVLPSMKNIIIIQFIGAFIAASQNTQMILFMTFGSAGTEVAGLHIFKEAYTLLKFGTAVSMGWMLGGALLIFTVYQLKALSDMEFRKTTQIDKELP